MGKEETNQSTNSSPNRSFRKPPPSLSSPGAHHVGGPEDFGQVNEGLNTPYYAKEGGSPRGPPNKKGVDRMASSKTAKTEDSVDASPSPPRIPLEMDHFDPTPARVNRWCRKHWIIPVVLMAITAILAVVIPVVVIMGRDPTSEPHQNIRSTPAPRPEKANMTLAELQVYVPSATEALLQRILEDPLSPQNIAFLWAKKDPKNFTATYVEDWRKDQRYAMAVLYHAMDGPNWSSMALFRSDWLSYYKDECDWMSGGRPHVRRLCNEEQQFDTFNLPILQFIRGSLPPEIAMLPHLQIINFTGSEFGTHIDALFAQLLELDDDLSNFLPGLKGFDLQDTQTTGTIPTSLSTLTKLNHLELSLNHNLVSSIPSEIGLLTNLELLDLADSGLTGSVPSELGSLSLLNTFSIKGNNMEQSPLPDAFCSENHATEWIQLEADWCQSQECCAV